MPTFDLRGGGGDTGGFSRPGYDRAVRDRPEEFARRLQQRRDGILAAT